MIYNGNDNDKLQNKNIPVCKYIHSPYTFRYVSCLLAKGLRLYAKVTRQFARVLQNFAFNRKSYRSVYSLKEISFN